MGAVRRQANTTLGLALVRDGARPTRRGGGKVPSGHEHCLAHADAPLPRGPCCALPWPLPRQVNMRPVDASRATPSKPHLGTTIAMTI